MLIEHSRHILKPVRRTYPGTNKQERYIQGDFLFWWRIAVTDIYRRLVPIKELSFLLTIYDLDLHNDNNLNETNRNFAYEMTSVCREQ